MQELLDAQIRYNVELVRNDEFWEWSFADWKDCQWCEYDEEDAEQPDYSWDMYRVFNPRADYQQRLTLIRTQEQMQDAMETLYWFRSSYGLEENVYHYDDYYYPSGDFWRCTMYTQEYGNIYQNYYWQYSYDTRMETFAPMADKVLLWMKEQYGGN